MAGTEHAAPVSDVGALVERHIDDAARYLRETMQAGKNLTPWSATPKATKKKWLVLAEGAVRPALLSAQEEAAGLRVERDGWRDAGNSVEKSLMAEIEQLKEHLMRVLAISTRAESKLADAVGVLDRAQGNAKRVDLHNSGALTDLVPPYLVDEMRAFLTSIKETGDAR